MVGDDRKIYDYQRSPCRRVGHHLRGSLTQFGDCDDLVREWDDAMVVMRSGDELRMTFSVPRNRRPERAGSETLCCTALAGTKTPT